MGHSFEAMAAIVGLYTSRVFQRFPTIKWGFMEAGCGWLPFWLHQIHEHAERMRFLLPDLPEDEEIIDIFHDRCFLTAEADDPLINAALDAGGERCMVWASDFPHFDCSMPGVAQELRDRTDLPPARLKALASTNAIEFFGLQNLVSAAAAAS